MYMIDINSYLKDITPINVLDIIGMDVLKNILNGYSYALESGITVIYTDNIPIDKSKLKRIDALEGEALKTYQKICAHWRDPNDCNMNDYCSKCDNNEAFLYFEKKWDGLRIFRCTPLSLWEMTYPITINNNVIGVLFVGQMIVNHSRFNWRKEFSDINLDNHIDWSTLNNEEDNHLDTVRLQIQQENNIPPKSKEDLLKIFDAKNQELVEGFTFLGIHDFKMRILKFVDFGRMMQELISEMYYALKESAGHKLIGQYSNKFDTIGYSESKQYWEDFALILSTLKEIPGIESVELFNRERSRYVRNVPFDDLKEANLYTSDIIQAIDTKKFIQIDHLKCKNSLNELDEGQTQIYGYRADTGFGSELCSTLILIKGNLAGEYNDIVEKICEISSIASNLALMIYRERENDKNYQRHVSNIGHSFRTPLQALHLVMEELKLEIGNDNLQIAAEIQYALDRIKDAKEDLEILLGPTTKNKDTIDIVSSINYLTGYMKPMADKQACRFVKLGDWPEKIFIKGNKYEIERAIINLLDNAIKYSFGNNNNSHLGYNEISISIKVENDIIVLSIQNYGIGIPSEKIDIIRKYNSSGNFIDKKRSRLGLGLGLPYSIEIIEKEGGWLEIDSSPAINSTEIEKEKLIKFLTTVKISLPIQK